MKRDIPKKIYLQWWSSGEVSWCWDNVNDDDIEYLRMTEHKKIVRALEEENKRLQAALEAADPK